MTRLNGFKNASRSPHGERGLKLEQFVEHDFLQSSLPAWGAWIEIHEHMQYFVYHYVAPRMGSVD